MSFVDGSEPRRGFSKCSIDSFVSAIFLLRNTNNPMVIILSGLVVILSLPALVFIKYAADDVIGSYPMSYRNRFEY